MGILEILGLKSLCLPHCALCRVKKKKQLSFENFCRCSGIMGGEHRENIIQLCKSLEIVTFHNRTLTYGSLNLQCQGIERKSCQSCCGWNSNSSFKCILLQFPGFPLPSEFSSYVAFNNADVKIKASKIILKYDHYSSLEKIESLVQEHTH